MNKHARSVNEFTLASTMRRLRVAAVGSTFVLSTLVGSAAAVAQDSTPPEANAPTPAPHVEPAPYQSQAEPAPYQSQAEPAPYQSQAEPAPEQSQMQSQPQPQAAPVAVQPAPAAVQPVPVEVPRKPTPFDRHRFRVSLGLGGGSYGGSGYFAIAVGGGYYVLPGLEIGFEVAQWFGSDPNVTQISPELRYVFYQLLRYIPVAPYLGAFYRHWFLWDGFDDYDTLGGRTGVLVSLGGGRAYVGIGLAYERMLTDCVNCDNFYPELTVAVSF